MTRHHRLLPGCDVAGRPAGSSRFSTLSRVAAIVVMCGAGAVFAWQVFEHLHALRDARSAGVDVLAVAAVAFVLCVVLVLLVEVVDVGRRLRQPEQLLRRALQRIRAGDVGFRVPERRGDPLAPLVHECNGLLEWLNRNPPSGVRVDDDLLDLPADDESQERGSP